MSINNEPGKLVKLTAFFLCIVFVLFFFEIGSYIVLSYETKLKKILNIRPNLGLDIYEIPDEDYLDHWVLTSGRSFTVNELIQAKKQSGKSLGAKLLENTARQYKISKNEIILHINTKGFKGPEIDESKSKLRILTIGDSCTFGSLFDKYSYPRVLENSLNRLKINVEVINAGVEGYKPFNVLYRMEEYKLLKPEITTIYIGMNDLYSPETIQFINQKEKSIICQFNSIHILSRLIRGLKTFFGKNRRSLDEYNKSKNPDKNDPLIEKIEKFTPRFIEELNQIIKHFKETESCVVLITIPGLYSMDKIPGKLALKKGHLPVYTDNPFVIAKLTERYNSILRNLAEKNEIHLVDLSKWAHSTLIPAESYFADSFHLTETGQSRIGHYLANRLIDLFPELFN